MSNKDENIEEKYNVAVELLFSLLDAGYGDIEFIIKKLLAISKIPIIDNLVDTIEEIMQSIEGNDEDIDMNSIIYWMYNTVISKINDKYDIDLEDGEDYESYPNGLASSIELLDNWKDNCDNLNDSQIKEIEDIFDKL